MKPNAEFKPEESPQGISLDQLTEAFAQAMRIAPQSPATDDAPETAASANTATTEQGGTEAVAVAESTTSVDLDEQQGQICPVSPLTILEAMLFVGNCDSAPLSAQKMADLMRGVEADEIPDLVAQLNERYSASGCPYYIERDGTAYRLVLRKAFHSIRNRFYGRVREAQLSQAAVDILALVAYQQPLTADQLTTLRGRPSGAVLSQLVRRGLLRIERKHVDKRRITQYFTTDRFLDVFGLDSLDDLPQSEELDR